MLNKNGHLIFCSEHPSSGNPVYAHAWFYKSDPDAFENQNDFSAAILSYLNKLLSSQNNRRNYSRGGKKKRKNSFHLFYAFVDVLHFVISSKKTTPIYERVFENFVLSSNSEALVNVILRKYTHHETST